MKRLRVVITGFAVGVLMVFGAATVSADGSVSECESIKARMELYPEGSSAHAFFEDYYERENCDEVLSD